MFKKNTERLIIISSDFSCHSSDERNLVKYLEANLPISLKRRAESLSCETVQTDVGDFPVNVHAEFLLGLMEKSRVVYGISHLLYLSIKKFPKMNVKINGEKISSEITDEGLQKLINTIYERLKKEKG